MKASSVPFLLLTRATPSTPVRRSLLKELAVLLRQCLETFSLVARVVGQEAARYVFRLWKVPVDCLLDELPALRRKNSFGRPSLECRRAERLSHVLGAFGS